jgi:hypothetical protein
MPDLNFLRYHVEVVEVISMRKESDHFEQREREARLNARLCVLQKPSSICGRRLRYGVAHRARRRQFYADDLTFV